jgi:hypothetical protein
MEFLLNKHTSETQTLECFYIVPRCAALYLYSECC